MATLARVRATPLCLVTVVPGGGCGAGGRAAGGALFPRCRQDRIAAARRRASPVPPRSRGSPTTPAPSISSLHREDRNDRRGIQQHGGGEARAARPPARRMEKAKEEQQPEHDQQRSAAGRRRPRRRRRSGRLSPRSLRAPPLPGPAAAAGPCHPREICAASTWPSAQAAALFAIVPQTSASVAPNASPAAPPRCLAASGDLKVSTEITRIQAQASAFATGWSPV